MRYKARLLTTTGWLWLAFILIAVSGALLAAYDAVLFLPVHRAMFVVALAAGALVGGLAYIVRLWQLSRYPTHGGEDNDASF